MHINEVLNFFTIGGPYMFTRWPPTVTNAIPSTRRPTVGRCVGCVLFFGNMSTDALVGSHSLS